MNYYVYSHIKKVGGACFYIGKGKGVRAFSKSSRNQHWHRVVAKYDYEVVILAENLTEDEALLLEEQYIQQIGLANLTNQSTGGKKNSGWKHQESTKKRIAQSSIEANKRKDKSFYQTEEHKLKCKTSYNKNRNKEHYKDPTYLEKFREACKGRDLSFFKTDEYRNKVRAEKLGKPNMKKRKPIEQYTLDGKLVAEWTGGAEAAKALSISPSAINGCLKKRNKSAAGYLWQYKIEKDGTH
jgi:hypothetical protein